MNQQLHVHFLPRLVTPEQLAGRTVVMIDLLRASTTICHALAAGATAVMPCREIDEARRCASSCEGEAVLAGERGGLPIDGFALGNSPAEYTTVTVGGRTVVLTTTNGTRALDTCRAAKTVLIGALVNLQALSRQLAESAEVHLVCAGTDGTISREDVLTAGAIAYTLARRSQTPLVENDSAQIARAAWRAVYAGAVAQGVSLTDHVAAELRATEGGRNLIAIGHEDDLRVAADLDRCDFVPEWDRTAGRIVRP